MSTAPTAKKLTSVSATSSSMTVTGMEVDEPALGLDLKTPNLRL